MAIPTSSLVGLLALLATFSLKSAFALQSIQAQQFVSQIALLGQSRSASEQRAYFIKVNRDYDALANQVPAEDLVEVRLARSYWAKQAIFLGVNRALACESAGCFGEVIFQLGVIRGFISGEQAQRLVNKQAAIGNSNTGKQLALVLAEFSDAKKVREWVLQLDPSIAALRRLGPPLLSKIRPMRKSGLLFDPNKWLNDPSMGVVEYIDGNPDHIRVRGLELRSGDIGIVELNHAGDGIFESFLERPGLAPHAMLYVTRRIPGPNRKVLLQPSLIEIYEEGWRSVPVTTALHPSFSWYSEWVRPPGLPDYIGSSLSRQLNRLGTIAFDFQARRAPTGGDFSGWEQPCATCTNLVRIPFEMAGYSLPYPTTPIHTGARRNLARLELADIEGVHTPTNVLNDSGFQKVGIVDNGMPEMAMSQALVVGRPEHVNTFGGAFAQRELQVENLPDWKQMQHWKSRWESLKITLGQSSSLAGSAARFVTQFKKAAIPKSASPTTISFYLRSDFEAGYIAEKVVCPALLAKPALNPADFSLMAFREDEILSKLVADALRETALEKERWYAPLP